MLLLTPHRLQYESDAVSEQTTEYCNRNNLFRLVLTPPLERVFTLSGDGTMTWNIDKIKNYRLKYKRYFGIDFGSDYEIHHIDFNRENNDIDNLVLLPKELHKKYHFVINQLSNCNDENGFIDFRISNRTVTDFSVGYLHTLVDVMNECSEWANWKRHGYDNIAKITVIDENAVVYIGEEV